jgi:hypothetical protein
MNTCFAAKTLVLTTALLFVGGAGLALRAAEKGKDKNKDKAELRAPLVVVSEGKAPNRDRADRVSYSAVIKKNSPSVVAVIVNRKERAAPAARATPSLEELLQRGFPGMPGQGPGPGQGQRPRRQPAPVPTRPGAAESPDLRGVRALPSPRVRPNGRGVIFEFTKCTEPTVDITGLHGKTSPARFIPRHIHVFARWINRVFPHNKRPCLALAVDITRTARHGRSAETNFMFTFLAHAVADKMFTHEEVIARNSANRAKNMARFVARKRRQQQFTAMRHLDETPQADFNLGRTTYS